MSFSRRDFLQAARDGAASVALRSLVSGIPVEFLLSPRRALAQQEARKAAAPTNPQFIIYASSGQGDPVNCNAPGSYDDAGIYHPPSPLFVKTKLMLGTQETYAAKTWTQLNAATLARTCFFHNATFTGIHSDEPKIMALGGYSQTRDHLVSALSQQLQAPLKTIQTAPMALAFRDLAYQGQPVSSLNPASLSTIYVTTRIGPSAVTKMRDQTVDALNTWLNANATPAQKSFLDDYVRTQQQARMVPDDLLTALAAITSNTVQDQMRAAILLFKMRMTPAVAVAIPFGGDNHSDADFTNEIGDYDGNTPASPASMDLGGKTGVAALADMNAQLTAAGMQDQVTFAMLNVFGRTMGPTWRQGRTHNSQHHVSLLIGSNVRGSVVGGVGPITGNGGGVALGIDPASGRGSDTGAIPATQTMSAFAKTLVRAAGLDEAAGESLVIGGQTVTAALRA